MGIFDYFKRASEARSGTKTIPLSQYQKDLRDEGGYPSRGAPRDITVDEALASPEVSAVVDSLATICAGMEIHVYREDDGTTEVTRGPIVRLIKQVPRPGLTAAKFWRFVFFNLFLHDEAIALKIRDGQRRVVALQPVPPGKTTRQSAKVENGISRLVYRIENVDYEAGDVLDFAHLSGDLLHVKPVASRIAATISTEQVLNEFAQMNLYDRPHGTVAPKEGSKVTSKQLIEARNGMEKKINEGHKILAIIPGVEYTPVSATEGDVKLADITQTYGDAVRRGYGVLPTAIGDGRNSVYRSTESSLNHLLSFKLTGVLRMVAQEMEYKLFDFARVVRFDPLSVIRVDSKMQSDIDRTYIDTGVKTRNEVRLDRGLPPSDQEGMDDHTISGSPVGGEEEEEEETPEEGANLNTPNEQA